MATSRKQSRILKRWRTRLSPYLVPPMTRAINTHLDEDKNWVFRYMERWATGPGEARAIQMVNHLLTVDPDCLCHYIQSKSDPRPVVAIAALVDYANFHIYWHCLMGGREDWNFLHVLGIRRRKKSCIVEDRLER